MWIFLFAICVITMSVLVMYEKEKHALKRYMARGRCGLPGMPNPNFFQWDVECEEKKDPFAVQLQTLKKIIVEKRRQIVDSKGRVITAEMQLKNLQISASGIRRKYETIMDKLKEELEDAEDECKQLNKYIGSANQLKQKFFSADEDDDCDENKKKPLPPPPPKMSCAGLAKMAQPPPRSGGCCPPPPKPPCPPRPCPPVPKACGCPPRPACCPLPPPPPPPPKPPCCHPTIKRPPSDGCLDKAGAPFSCKYPAAPNYGFPKANCPPQCPPSLPSTSRSRDRSLSRDRALSTSPSQTKSCCSTSGDIPRRQSTTSSSVPMRKASGPYKTSSSTSRKSSSSSKGCCPPKQPSKGCCPPKQQSGCSTKQTPSLSSSKSSCCAAPPEPDPCAPPVVCPAMCSCPCCKCKPPPPKCPPSKLVKRPPFSTFFGERMPVQPLRSVRQTVYTEHIEGEEDSVGSYDTTTITEVRTSSVSFPPNCCMSVYEDYLNKTMTREPAPVKLPLIIDTCDPCAEIPREISPFEDIVNVRHTCGTQTIEDEEEEKAEKAKKERSSSSNCEPYIKFDLPQSPRPSQ